MLFSLQDWVSVSGQSDKPSSWKHIIQSCLTTCLSGPVSNPTSGMAGEIIGEGPKLLTRISLAGFNGPPLERASKHLLVSDESDRQSGIPVYYVSEDGHNLQSFGTL